jgi:hypothetical protein
MTYGRVIAFGILQLLNELLDIYSLFDIFDNFLDF